MHLMTSMRSPYNLKARRYSCKDFTYTYAEKLQREKHDMFLTKISRYIQNDMSHERNMLVSTTIMQLKRVCDLITLFNP
jgi:hypothetical protein